MNTLAGRASYGATTGAIRINGARDTVRNYSAFVGFVPQDDIMLPELTVYETLHFYARMRLPRTMAARKQHALIADVIESLGLAHVAHAPIGDAAVRGISGGQ